MKHILLSKIGFACQWCHKVFYRLFVEPIRVEMLLKHGKKVRVLEGAQLSYRNIECGDSVSIGRDCLFISSKAKIYIGNHVMFAPRVTIVTGDHRIDIPEKLMDSITDDEKLPENDQDVVFQGDNWIGTGAIILKGVTVGKGAVIAAGSLVMKDVPPYCVVGGIPARVIKKRIENG